MFDVHVYRPKIRVQQIGQPKFEKLNRFTVTRSILPDIFSERFSK